MPDVRRVAVAFLLLLFAVQGFLHNVRAARLHYKTALACKRSESSKQVSQENIKKPVRAKPMVKALPEDEINFIDYRGTRQDIPTLDKARWFRFRVKKSGEKKADEWFNNVIASGAGDWDDEIKSVVYPKVYTPKFKGKKIDFTTRPMLAGILFMKCKMSPDLADWCRIYPGFKYFEKSKRNGLVMPLTEEESLELEAAIDGEESRDTSKYSDLRKGGYVSVVNGPHKGRYGILEGVKLGKLEIILRGDYKDEFDVAGLDDVEYLAEPPEKKWDEMTGREAVLSLMEKDPHSPLLKQLRKEGVLNDILYQGQQRPRYGGGSGGEGVYQNRSGDQNGWNYDQNRDHKPRDGEEWDDDDYDDWEDDEYEDEDADRVSPATTYAAPVRDVPQQRQQTAEEDFGEKYDDEYEEEVYGSFDDFGIMEEAPLPAPTRAPVVTEKRDATNYSLEDLLDNFEEL